MSTTFNKMIVSAGVFALLILASGAQAAPSLGIGRPYYGSSNRPFGSQSFRSSAPAYSTETRQSFSYEPSEQAVTTGSGCPQHAVAPQAAKKSDLKQDVAKTPQAPQTTRRSYSYEPAMEPAPSVRSFNRGAAPAQDSWLRTKADPRRYGR
jgi:hypothetical protein